MLREPGIEPKMRPLLDDPHLGVRLAALKALEGTLNDELLAQRRPSVDELLAALNDPDSHLRADVIPWLAGAIEDDPRANAIERERLTRALEDADFNVQYSAARHLALLGAFAPLFDGLQGEDESTQIACASVLATAGGAVSEPLRLLLRHNEPGTRQWAAEILGARHDAQAVPGLIALLLDNDSGVREEATDALAAMPEHSREMLFGLFSDERFGPHAKEPVRRMGRATVQPLIQLLAAKDEPVQDAVSLLVAVGRPAVNPLINTIDRFGPPGKAVRRMGRAAVQPLTQLLAVKDERVRENAVSVLVAIGRPAVKPLISAMGYAKFDTTLQAGVAEALRGIGHRRGLAALNATSGSHNELAAAAVRTGAAAFRGMWPILRTASRVFKALEDGRAAARRVIRGS
jgi:HEAT repeat protein